MCPISSILSIMKPNIVLAFPDQVQFITEALPIVSDGYISYLSFIKHVSKNYVLESLNTLQFLSETELAFADAQGTS